MSDEASEAAVPGHFTEDQRRRILNLLDVADHLETFSESDKVALALLLKNAGELNALCETRAFWANLRSKIKWFLIQCVSFLGAAATSFEIWDFVQKWRAHK